MVSCGCESTAPGLRLITNYVYSCDLVWTTLNTHSGDSHLSQDVRRLRDNSQGSSQESGARPAGSGHLPRTDFTRAFFMTALALVACHSFLDGSDAAPLWRAHTSPRSHLTTMRDASLCAASHLDLAHTLILRPCHFDNGPRARHHTCARPPLRRVHVPAACAVAALPERDGLLTPAFHLLSCSPAPASRWLMLMQLRSCADSPVRFCQECSCHDRPCPSPAAAGLRRAPLGN